MEGLEFVRSWVGTYPRGVRWVGNEPLASQLGLEVI